MSSPRFHPAGLQLVWGNRRIVFDAGVGAEPDGPIDAWLVTDSQAELSREIHRLGQRYHVQPDVQAYSATDGLLRLRITPHPVAHTSHPTYGYLLRSDTARAVWAPEFWEFPQWAADADLMFADAAGWDRAIRFAGGVGGHAPVLAIAERARQLGIRRLVFAHIGRPSIRAIDDGRELPFGEWGAEGRTYTAGSCTEI